VLVWERNLDLRINLNMLHHLGMSVASSTQPRPIVSKSRFQTFTEAPAWSTIGAGWRPLYGGFENLGYSIEWHDFTNPRDLDWSRSFHPEGLEICLNLAGFGEVEAGDRTLTLAPATAGFYFQNDSRLAGIRRGKEQHRFITIEFSMPFMAAHFQREEPGLHRCVSDLLRSPARRRAEVSEPIRLTIEQQQMISSLRQPPVCAAAQRLWYEGKALETAAAILYRPAPESEFFCERVKWLNRERASKVLAILKEDLSAPPPLQEIARRVGCSHFYLSRIFSQETGKTISACLRELRMERAAALLQAGKLNVTEVALEVGYSSLSHFTTTFRETFSCCPGLYPLGKPVVKLAPRRDPPS
jgi:AraC-like DNA-binding protein